MKHDLPTRKLREHPDFNQLKRQAKELLRAFLSGDPIRRAEVDAYYRKADPTAFALHDAQLVLARSYGFESWPKLKAYVDGANIKRLAEIVRADDLRQAEILLKKRPELANMTMSYGDEHRPIHFAVMNRSPEMTRLLMQYGADARRGIHPHRHATTAWILAKERGYDEILAIIEEEEQKRRERESPSKSVESQDETSATPSQFETGLRNAVASQNPDYLRALHAEGKLFNPVTWSGGLLTLAVKRELPEMLSLLLDLGFDPDERVSEGEGPSLVFSQGYPLWHAAACGRIDMAEILLRHGADPNAVVDSSGSAVYSAYSHRQWLMAEFLRSHGGIVGAGTASIYRQTETVRQMVAEEDRGTLPEGTVSPGRTLAEDMLDFGSSGGDPEIVRMALKRLDWERDDPRWFRYLVRSLDFWNHIPWLYAANPELDRGTYIECFRQVLERCDPNIVGGFGRTALHEVAAMGDHVAEEEAVPFAKALLDAGAKTHARDDILRSTPLGWACRWGRAEVANALLKRGCDAVELNAEPWTRPRAWADKMGHTRVLEVLKSYGG